MRKTPRKAVVASALIASAAMIAVALPTSATAGTQADAPKAQVRAGALQVRLSPSERASLLADAQATVATTARTLGLGGQEQLLVKSVLKDADGTVHTRYERTFAGLPVLGGDLVVHAAANGAVKGVSKATKATVKVASTTAVKSADSVKTFALGRAKAKGTTAAKADTVRKVVWAASGKPVLAWESVIGGVQHDGTPSELHVITDATNGAKLFEYQGIETGTGTGQYNGQVTLGTTLSGSTYEMTDGTRGGHKTYDLNGGSSGTGTLFTDADDVWGNGLPSDRQTAGVDAAFGAQATWDYYKNVHGRNGIRNDGVGAYSRVHYGNAYVNAFWSDSCFCMTYGDGSGNTKPLTSLDVAAHEMSHGVTSNTAGLIYSGESGGLNEATSDIMAAAVEFYVNSATDPGDYLVGEKIDINGDGTPLRYMDKPSKDGTSKDAWYSGIGSIDVHYSSGPANHWFYLASEGSGAKVVNGVSYNSPTSDGLPVTAIGRDAAAKIWYRALSTYMTSSTNYAAARTATLQAAADLYGLGSDTYNNTANAWAAINVGSRIVQGVTVTDPGLQTTLVNKSASLQVQATSTNPGALTYTATGLPAGLSINASTGLISGTPTTLGTSTVTVTVTDSTNASSTATFTWNVVSVIKTFENTTDVAIPDGGAAVFSDVNVTGIAGKAPSALKVDVNIKHTWRGDLVIDLVAPDGTLYRLKDSDISDSADDVLATYTVNASKKTANGTWKLKVQDMFRGDSGFIDSWKLNF
ncbi:M4 family metallopeptidase [Streptomyces sp. Ncost-T10-10d]|uniref:M4 family metallopeptidase n=1 Tax=Streptomyces sp. Ncost-T10-10d TaxID=1839774 RepID=UPI00081EE300|nr:M4 family metallopeptidase [Streptomyces sp. Ncost-T10-10d]SCF65528.1 Zn-dependent metalloprotease [Streptomyces sp. Ncost-T10-10d]